MKVKQLSCFFLLIVLASSTLNLERISPYPDENPDRIGFGSPFTSTRIPPQPFFGVFCDESSPNCDKLYLYYEVTEFAVFGDGDPVTVGAVSNWSSTISFPFGESNQLDCPDGQVVVGLDLVVDNAQIFKIQCGELQRDGIVSVSTVSGECVKSKVVTSADPYGGVCVGDDLFTASFGFESNGGQYFMCCPFTGECDTDPMSSNRHYVNQNNSCVKCNCPDGSDCRSYDPSYPLAKTCASEEICPALDWEGEFADLLAAGEQWIVNSNTSIVEISVKNPYFESFALSANVVESIVLEYRRVDSTGDWVQATSISPESENSDGILIITWDTSFVNNNLLSLRVTTVCVDNADPQLASASSSSINGVVDRVPPTLLGTPKPINHIYTAGTEISIAFNKNILCSGDTYSLTAQNELGVNVNMLSSCENNIITVQFGSNNDLGDLSDLEITVSVTGYTDLVGNAGDLQSWTFTYTSDADNASTGSSSSTEMTETENNNDGNTKIMLPVAILFMLMI